MLLMWFLQYIFCLDVVIADGITLLQKNLLILTLYIPCWGPSVVVCGEWDREEPHPRKQANTTPSPLWLHPALT